MHMTLHVIKLVGAWCFFSQAHLLHSYAKHMRYTNTMTTAPEYIYHNTPQIDDVLLKLIKRVEKTGALTSVQLNAFLNECNRGITAHEEQTSKKQLIPRYMEVKHYEHQIWKSWGVTDEAEQKLIQTLRIKPRRSASGVATITLLTKPWPCSSNCIFCPSDIRMPKSYMSREPACQRAEQCLFDPFLQTTLRLQALVNMGHPTDKIEIIILGGTWSEYPTAYQCWFIREVFRALNMGYASHKERNAIVARYERCGLRFDPHAREIHYEQTQHDIDAGKLTYNEAFTTAYTARATWVKAAAFQRASMDEVREQQRINESAHHRVVGLVIETRPDTISVEHLYLMRALGCTKVQMGIQVLNEEIRQRNLRKGSLDDIKQAFELLRLFGFKIHVHAMVNLLGSTPDIDKKDFKILVHDSLYLPDEVKLYPCVLVDSARLKACYERGLWQAYTEEELVDVLVSDVLATPCFTRISRMIRDISSTDIISGNKKGNLRQLVEQKIAQSAILPREIRMREIATSMLDPRTLHMEVVPYATNVSTEYFLQWVDDHNRIAGFLRLSLPHRSAIDKYCACEHFPILPHEAMIREVHVYGTTAQIEGHAGTAQHHGLGKQLISRAKSIAREAGYTSINVISSIGTRKYYRSQGFMDNGLYQRANLACLKD